eukprot:6457-Heterococcus_DN1.PRE.2
MTSVQPTEMTDDSYVDSTCAIAKADMLRDVEDDLLVEHALMMDYILDSCRSISVDKSTQCDAFGKLDVHGVKDSGNKLVPVIDTT